MFLIQWRAARLGFCAVMVLASIAWGDVLYEEGREGDLSGDRNAPTVMTIQNGDNVLFATTSLGDEEYFTIVVPPDQVFANLIVLTYPDFDVSFIGIQRGTTFTVDPAHATEHDMLGWMHFGYGEIDMDILPIMASAPDAVGFTPPLGPGSYTFWIQQLSDAESDYQLDFVAIPEPTAWVLLAAPALYLARRRRGTGLV